MIISNSRKFIFVHVHKCGGSSIAQALEDKLSWNDVLCGGTPYGERINPVYRSRFAIHKHSTAQAIRGVVGEAVWDDYFTFSFVRNPFARALSLYYFLKKKVQKRIEIEKELP